MPEMSWRWKLLKKTSNQIIKTRSFSSSHNISSPILDNNPSKSFAAKHSKEISDNSKIVVLTPQIVVSTLLNCPSDLVALSFFLWCARQPAYIHECRAFDHMVDVVNRLTQRFKTVEGIIGQLESVGFVTKPQTLLLLLRIYWRGGMYGLVFETFEEMIKYGYTPNTFARNIVMDVLFKIGRVNEALSVLKETQVPNFLSFSIAVCNLCRLNDLINVQDVLRNMLRKRYYLNAEMFSMVLNCYCKLGRLWEALQLLGLMITVGISPSVHIWSILIDGFCKSGRLGTASYLLEKMVDAGGSLDVVTCTSLIKGFMETGNPVSALSILSDLESEGCSPDLVLCNVLIDCLSKMERYDDALAVFYSLPKRKLTPDSYTFCAITTNVSLSKQFDLLPLLISGIDIQADLVVCNSLLNYFCKAGYPSGAVELYGDMLDRGFVPDMYSYAGLLSGLCGIGKISEAVNVYHGIIRSHHGLDAHIHTVIINGLIKSGRFHSSIKLFRKAAAEKYPLDVVSYTVAINGLLRGGRSGEAYTLYGQMKEACIVPNAHTYKVLLSGFCRVGDVEMVKHILRDMVDTRMELDWKMFKMIWRLSSRLHQFHSFYNLFVELWDSGLMSDKAIHVLTDELTLSVNLGDSHLSLLKSNIEDAKDVGMFISEGVPDVVASVG